MIHRTIYLLISIKHHLNYKLKAFRISFLNHANPASEEFNTPASINANPVEEDVFTREDVQSSSKLRGQVNSTPQIRRVSSGRCFEILA